MKVKQFLSIAIGLSLLSITVSCSENSSSNNDELPEGVRESIDKNLRESQELTQGEFQERQQCQLIQDDIQRSNCETEVFFNN